MEAQEPPVANGAAVGVSEPVNSRSTTVAAPDKSGANGSDSAGSKLAAKDDSPAVRPLRKSSNRLAAAAAALAEKSPANSPGKNGRRERKQKFDVKQLLNIRGSGGNVSPGAASTPVSKQTRKTVQENAPVNDEAGKKTRRSGRVRGTDVAHASESAKTPTTNGDSGVTTKNSKEPLLRSSSPTLLVTGKRERKRKKFWDEQEEPTAPSPNPPPTPSSKVIKKSAEKKPATPSATSNSGSSSVTPSSANKSKSRKEKKSASAVTKDDTPAKSSKTSQNASADKPTPESRRAGTVVSKREKPLAAENGNGTAELAYLTFDLSEDPEVIAKQMIEGVNIPGPGVPIPVDSSNLPTGWQKRVIQREIGVTKGKWDVYIMSPQGKAFRSKIDLQKYFDEKKLQLSSDTFDFSLDNNLKRLRQIWKQCIIIPKKNKLAAEATKESSSPAATEKTRNNGHNSQATPVSTPSKPASPSVTASGTKSSRGASAANRESTESLGIESETGQGLRCSVDKCGKLFRNNRLLHMHIKHYHPKVFRETLSKAKKGSANHTDSNDSTPLSEQQPVPDCERVAGPNANDAEQGSEPVRKESKKRRLASESKQAGDPKRQKTTSTASLSSNTAEDEDLARLKRLRHPSSRKSSVHVPNDVEDDVFVSLPVIPSRTRNDSILSVGSEATTPGCTDEFAGPTPPTFRVSKRRQAQLSRRSSRVSKPSSVSVSVDENSVELESCADSNTALEPVPGTSTPMASASYPPSEMDASVVSEHLTNDEVVNCTCRRTEEDGLMIQCDICLCWQHGACLGIEDDNLVPDKHVCQICRDPPGARANSKFSLDQDWLKEGKMLTIPLEETSSSSAASSSKNKYDENAFRKLSELMADLANLNKVLHALRVKLRVASQRNNAKVFMWSSPWLTSDSLLLPKLPPPDEEGGQGQHRVQHDQAAAEPSTGNGDVKALREQSQLQRSEELSVGADTSPTGKQQDHTVTAGIDPTSSIPGQEAVSVSDEKKHSGDADSSGLTNGPAETPVNGTDSPTAPTSNGIHEESGGKVNCSAESDLPRQVDPGGIKGNGVADDTTNDSVCMDMDGAVDHDLGSGGGNVATAEENVGMGDIDLSLIPSVSEVEQLLPSIIQASLEAQMGGGAGTNGHDGAAAAALQSLSGVSSVGVPPPPMSPQKPVFIPEQKRIDRDESRLNLLDHVERVQDDLDRIFDQVEAQLGVLEGRDEQPSGQSVNQLSRDANVLLTKTKAIAMTLAQDLSTSKKLMCALTKR